jgi:hypothetical protein
MFQRVLFISTKAQVWELDLVIAITIFFVVGVLFYTYSTNLQGNQGEQLHSLTEEAQSLSHQLVSSGYPSNWTGSSNVLLAGLTDGNKRLQSHKVQGLNNLDYATLKHMTGSNRDFLVFFEDNGELLEINGVNEIGKPGITHENINVTENPNNIIKIERLLFYNASFITMVVYVW